MVDMRVDGDRRPAEPDEPTASEACIRSQPWQGRSPVTSLLGSTRRTYCMTIHLGPENLENSVRVAGAAWPLSPPSMTAMTEADTALLLEQPAPPECLCRSPKPSSATVCWTPADGKLARYCRRLRRPQATSCSTSRENLVVRKPSSLSTLSMAVYFFDVSTRLPGACLPDPASRPTKSSTPIATAEGLAMMTPRTQSTHDTLMAVNGARLALESRLCIGPGRLARYTDEMSRPSSLLHHPHLPAHREQRAGRALRRRAAGADRTCRTGRAAR